MMTVDSLAMDGVLICFINCSVPAVSFRDSDAGHLITIFESFDKNKFCKFIN